MKYLLVLVVALTAVAGCEEKADAQCGDFFLQRSVVVQSAPVLGFQQAYGFNQPILGLQGIQTFQQPVLSFQQPVLQLNAPGVFLDIGRSRVRNVVVQRRGFFFPRRTVVRQVIR